MELQVFSNAEFGSVRSIMVNNEPFFVGKDVAEILGYSRTADAIKVHVDKEDNRFDIGLRSGSIWEKGSGNQDVCVEKYSHGLFTLISHLRNHCHDIFFGADSCFGRRTGHVGLKKLHGIGCRIHQADTVGPINNKSYTVSAGKTKQIADVFRNGNLPL